MINSPLPEGGKGEARGRQEIYLYIGEHSGMGRASRDIVKGSSPPPPHVSKHELRRTGGSVSILDLSFAPLRGSEREGPAWRGRWGRGDFYGDTDGWTNQSHYCFPHGVCLIINWIKAWEYCTWGSWIVIHGVNS